MSQNKEIIEELCDFIKTSVQEGFKKVDFIKEFKSKLEDYLKEKIE